MKRESEGVLSVIEREAFDARGAREHYELMLGLARKAAEELRHAQFEGLPRMAPMSAGPHARIARLINTFAWANRSLFNAAKTVVALEDLPDENDTVFEVLL